MFQKLERKNEQKELVLTLNNRAISSQFPCSLIDDALGPINVKYIAPGNVAAEKVPKTMYKCQAEEFVVFHVNTVNCRKVLRNPALRKDELSVYAYKGETVRDALQRDDRLHHVSEHELFRLDNNDKVMLSALVDDLNDVLLEVRPSSQPGNEPQSLEDDA